MLLLAITTLSAAPIKVGLVTDVGRVNDRSFNQSAWEGVELAKSNLGLGDRDIKYIETQDAKDYADNLQSFVNRHVLVQRVHLKPLLNIDDF